MQGARLMLGVRLWPSTAGSSENCEIQSNLTGNPSCQSGFLMHKYAVFSFVPTKHRTLVAVAISDVVD